MATWESASVAFLAAAEGTEQVELTEPWQAILARGGGRYSCPPHRAKSRCSTTSTAEEVVQCENGPTSC